MTAGTFTTAAGPGATDLPAATPVPRTLLRAWFAVGLLLFAVISAAIAYIDVVLAGRPLLDNRRPEWWTFYPGGDPWMVGDWLINYGDGFVRRGLFGQLFLTFAPAGQAGLWVLFAIQISIYLALLVYCLKVLHRSRYSWSSIALVCGPAALAFIGWVPSIDAAFRKELLVFLAMVLLAWSRSRRRSRTGVVVLVVAAFAVYVLAVFSWEPSALLLPAMGYLLVHRGAPHPELDVFRRSAGGLFIVVAGWGAFLSFLLHGDVSSAQAICDAVREAGFRGPNVCSGEVGSSGGAIEAIGWTSYKTTQDLALALPVYAGFLPLIALALVPTVASRWFRSNWIWAALVIAGVAPLYFIVTDWGRWTHVIGVALLVCVTADDPNDAESHIWNPLSTLFYVSMWGMPHWMAFAQLGSEWWPRVGLLATTTEQALDRAWAQQPTLMPRPDGQVHDLLGRYLANSPAAQWDAWEPMRAAVENLGKGGTSLHEPIRLDAAVPFPHPSTSLLLAEPAYLYSPLDISHTMNVVGWTAVAGTAVVMFALLLHLTTTALRARPSHRTITLLLLGAAVATLLFPPLLRAWDLGQPETITTFLCMLALYAHVIGRKAAAGIILGLASLLQPALGLIWVWRLVRRDWQFAANFAATTGVGVLLAMVRHGPQVFLDHLRTLTEAGPLAVTFFADHRFAVLLPLYAVAPFLVLRRSRGWSHTAGFTALAVSYALMLVELGPALRPLGAGQPGELHWSTVIASGVLAAALLGAAFRPRRRPAGTARGRHALVETIAE